MIKFKGMLLRQLRIFASAILLLSVACVDTDEYFAGGFLSDGQDMKVLQSDIQWFTDTGEAAFSVRGYQTTSMLMSNVGRGMVGAERDSIFGLRRCGFYSQYTPLLALDEDGFGLEPMLDSVLIYFTLTEYQGDVTERHTYEVREVLNDDFLRNSADTVFCFMSVDSLVEVGVLGDVLFEFDYPDVDGENEIDAYTDSMRVDVITDAGYDLIKGLMLMERADGTLVDYEIYNDNHEEFIESFKGLSIMPKELTNSADTYGATYGIILETSGFGFYGRSLYEEDPSLIADTISMTYVFRDSSLYTDADDDDIVPGGVSINFVERDYTYAAFDESQFSSPNELGEEISELYVEGIGGVIGEISFEKALFEHLDDMLASENLASDQDYNSLFINVARLQLYVAELEDYDYVSSGSCDISNLVERYDGYPLRLGLYWTFGTTTDEDGDSQLVSVSDYNYYNEINYSVYTDYDGALNRGKGYYEMNIPLHIQGLWKMWQEEVEAVGGDSADVDWESVTWNKVYVAPLAELLFTTRRVVLQGAPTSDDTLGAPLRLRLTYTLVKSE